MSDVAGGSPGPQPAHRDQMGSALERIGRQAWLLVGIGLAALLAVALLTQVSGLVIPLVIASVIGALLAPVVDWLGRWRVPRSIGAMSVLLGLGAVALVSLWLVVAGIADQAGEISEQLAAGLARISEQFAAWSFDVGTPDEIQERLTGFFTGSAAGLSSTLSGLLSSIAAFVIGFLVATFLLYYVLADWHRLTSWVGAHLGVDPQTGEGVLGDAVSSVRQYFGGLTISAVVTSVLIGGAAVVLDVPLAFTIALVTLVTSYVPYLGAIVSGAFATLIALGAQGLTAGLIMLAVILVVQNVIQTLVLTRVTSDSLSIHPIVNLGSTVVGAALAGILGATLSAPLVAMALRIRHRLLNPSVAATGAAGEVVSQAEAAGSQPTS